VTERYLRRRTEKRGGMTKRAGERQEKRENRKWAPTFLRKKKKTVALIGEGGKGRVMEGQSAPGGGPKDGEKKHVLGDKEKTIWRRPKVRRVGGKNATRWACCRYFVRKTRTHSALQDLSGVGRGSPLREKGWEMNRRKEKPGGPGSSCYAVGS